MSTDVVNPAVRDAEMLTAGLIRVRPSLLGLSSYTAAWIICTCIIQFTFKPLIDIDFSVTLRCFT